MIHYFVQVHSFAESYNIAMCTGMYVYTCNFYSSCTGIVNFVHVNLSVRRLPPTVVAAFFFGNGNETKTKRKRNENAP